MVILCNNMDEKGLVLYYHIYFIIEHAFFNQQRLGLKDQSVNRSMRLMWRWSDTVNNIDSAYVEWGGVEKKQN